MSPVYMVELAPRKLGFDFFCCEEHVKFIHPCDDLEEIGAVKINQKDFENLQFHNIECFYCKKELFQENSDD